MKIPPSLHLAYCTNIHRGHDWAETFQSLKQYTLQVRDQISPNQDFAIGLRLSHQAAWDLRQGSALLQFQQWLEKERCYVFTINGFPYGSFHGAPIKEGVYQPDWTQKERLDYTCLLVDLLAEILPSGMEGSISTLPGSFKEFIHLEAQQMEIRSNLVKCSEHIAETHRRTEKSIQLGLEPEPLCLLETTSETIRFFEKIRQEHPHHEPCRRFLGITYDTCHLALQFENPFSAVSLLQQAEVRIAKIHLSSALSVKPTAESLSMLKKFADEVYLHQVVSRMENGDLYRTKDLDEALKNPSLALASEWRIHFHIPLHTPHHPLWGNTTSHVLDFFTILKNQPSLCSHLEMETYTWEVLPTHLKSERVVDQLVREYQWTLDMLDKAGLPLDIK